MLPSCGRVTGQWDYIIPLIMTTIKKHRTGADRIRGLCCQNFFALFTGSRVFSFLHINHKFPTSTLVIVLHQGVEIF